MGRTRLPCPTRRPSARTPTRPALPVPIGADGDFNRLCRARLKALAQPAAEPSPEPSVEPPAAPAAAPSREDGEVGSHGVEEGVPTAPVRAVPAPPTPPPPSRARDRSMIGGGWGLLLVPVLLGALVLIGDDDGERDTSDLPSAPPAAAQERSRPTIDLPPPGGDRPRTRPLQTTILITPDVLDDGGFASTVAEELPVVIDYLEQHGLVGDGLTFEADATPRRVSGTGDELRIVAAAPPTTERAPDEVLAALEEQRRPFPDDDHALFVVTTDPRPWARALPADRGDPHGPPDRAPASRARLIVPGHDFDPDQHGDLAATLAQQWVHAYGGRYPADAGEASVPPSGVVPAGVDAELATNSRG